MQAAHPGGLQYGRRHCVVGCTQARVFQSSKCALTGAPLELPAVHFLCGHAFNLRSLGENDRDCPLCAPQFRAILDIRNSLRAGAAEQASFGMARFVSESRRMCPSSVLRPKRGCRGP